MFGGDAYSVSAFQNHHRQAQPRTVRCCRGRLSKRRTAVQRVRPENKILQQEERACPRRDHAAVPCAARICRPGNPLERRGSRGEPVELPTCPAHRAGISSGGSERTVSLHEQLQEIEIFDKPGLFSNGRLRDEDVPEGLYRYDLRGSDYDPGQPILVEKTVIVNHAASVLMAEELDLGADGRLELGEEGLNFTGGLLTVREFMKEQEEKNNGLLHGDSYNITVEGHIGTWYAIDETEVNGEKFFLLEHEEYGDEAACVAVNEQGKLVAEDLWNGFDEDFQDAVKEYFAEKNPAFQKEAQAAPVTEESRTDDSDVPVYYESFSYAAENGEVDLYRISRQLNEDCRNAIEEAIADNFDGMHLADDATKSVVEQFGMERMGYILAYTLNYNNHDGRYSHSNKEWADTTCKGERGSNIRTDWIVRSHPAVLNGFVDMYRKELAAEQQREPEKPFVQQFYILGKRSKRHYFNSSPKGNLPIMVVIIVGDKYIC